MSQGEGRADPPQLNINDDLYRCQFKDIKIYQGSDKMRCWLSLGIFHKADKQGARRQVIKWKLFAEFSHLSTGLHSRGEPPSAAQT